LDDGGAAAIVSRPIGDRVTLTGSTGVAPRAAAPACLCTTEASLWQEGRPDKALVCIGLFTRPAAFILSGDMAVAYFMAHLPKNFSPALNGGDAAILYCFIFFYFIGPGPWSLDYILRRAAFSEEAPLAAGSRRA
jgi:hypothetical protein